MSGALCKYIFFACTNSLVTQSLLLNNSLNSDVSRITSQAAVLLGSVKNKYTHWDIIEAFDMIKSLMDEHRMQAE